MYNDKLVIINCCGINELRHEKNESRVSMNQNPQFHVVLDLDGTTPPITVVSGAENEYYDALKNRCKKTVDFRNDYRRPDDPSLSLPAACKRQMKSVCPCDKASQKKFLTKRFPLWKIMRKYKWRDDLPNDIISGLTVGIMQLPQGMAYALLAELPPVVGLYMAFFPVLIYFIFGTSKHISMGTVALCSLLTGSVISRFYNPELAASILGPDVTKTLTQEANATATDAADPIEIELPNHAKIAIASSLCLLVGLVQLVMGVFRMGFITTYMSDPMIGGFTTGAAVHVGTSQVKYVFGLHIPRSDGIFQIIKTYALIVHHIAETNYPTLIMSVICMVILYIVKVQVNQRFKAKMKFPVPVELLVVVAGTMLSYFLKFSENYKMTIVGEIPAGLPKPSIPSLPSTSVYTADVFIIAIVAFSQCVGLAALMAKKHGYSYDANQELIAYGAGNIFGSFFSCYPYAASVSRSSVQESAGGRTQLASVVSATLVLIVIVSIGPLFQSLPNCVLASIIMVALRSLFLQFLELPKIFRTSAYDFVSMPFKHYETFTQSDQTHIVRGNKYCNVRKDIVSCYVIKLCFYTCRIKAENLQKINAIHLYEDSTKYRQTESVPGIKVIGYSSPLYYANGSMFVKQVYTLSGVIPEKRKKHLKRLKKATKQSLNVRNSTMQLVTESNEMGSTPSLNYTSDVYDQVSNWNGTNRQANLLTALAEKNQLHHIVIDLSGVTFIDSVGAKVLKQLVEDYEAVEIKVLLSNVNDEVWRVLESTKFLKTYTDRLYLTVDDAINAVNIKTQIKQAADLKYPQRMMYRENNNPDAAEEDALLTLESSF
ncbi:solute carrier family 26 member 6-like [Mercenaria mercenaria]|uniref:solute carrier family 26 member 6-like n=1 Tax=Mercenaria mercenaria TaxID=6596 RepID=UPI00234EE311|nr:solute carrier family 26 member 6-like [Mercenaria mercenaria]